MTPWFRFYGETLNDPKILKLSDNLYRIWVGVLCAASKNEGRLPPLEDLAFLLRMKPAKIAAALESLIRSGLIDQHETFLSPHNWHVRQYRSDVSTERVKRFINPQRTVSETPPDTDTDTDTDKKKESKEDALPSVALRAVVSPSPKKRAIVLPADWKPSLKAYELAEQFGQNVQIVESIFRDYLASSGKLYADHDAAFHNFIRNQNNFNRGGSINGVRQSENPRSGSIIAAIDRALERSIAEDAAIAAPEDTVFSLPGRSVRRS